MTTTLAPIEPQATTVPELEPHDDDELDELFGRLEQGDDDNDEQTDTAGENVQTEAIHE